MCKKVKKLFELIYVPTKFPYRLLDVQDKFQADPVRNK